MKREDIWKILKISETKDENAIKAAYRQQLAHTNPEDDAKGFMDLRAAYEEAVRLISEPEEGHEQNSLKDDFDLFIDRVDTVYLDIKKRCNVEMWKELLNDPICTELDTYLQTRERLLAYLMNHYYIPHQVWIMLDAQFSFVNDKEDLSDIFPPDFMEYVVRQIDNYSLLDLELIRAEGNDSVDDYIRSYYNIKRMIDQNDMEGIEEEFERLGSTGVYHPQYDAEKLRYLTTLDEKEEIKKIIDRLLPYKDDDYIAYYLGKAFWSVEEFDKASEIWEELCRKYPNHYSAWTGLLEYYIHTGRYKEANERAIELMKVYTRDEELHRLLIRTNEHLIKEYEDICKEDPSDLSAGEELAWCYYQNSHLDECIELLKEFPEETNQQTWYIKLHGYVYAKKNEFKKALEYLFKWKELLKNLQDSENYNRDMSICSYMIGICYINETEYEKSISYLQDAISFEENPGERLNSMERMAFALLKLENNEDCIDVCDKITEESPGYYPAYLLRQEAYFNMKNGQGVIDDYHNAVNIYRGYAKPYLLAAKVYFFYGQYEDSLSVINRAKEENIVSYELELYYGKNLRYTAQTTEERNNVLETILNLIKSIEEKEQDEDEFDDLAEVYSEAARAYADLDRFNKGLESIEKAIELNPSDGYYAIKAYLCMDMERYKEASEILEGITKENHGAEYWFVCLARCYEKLNREKDALEYYKKVLEINSENSEALEKAGDIYMDMYKEHELPEYYNMAIAYGEKLLEINQNCYTYIHVGIMYEKGYELEKALECCKKASELDPGDIWPHNNAGYIYKLMKRYDDAIAEYKKAIELMKPGQSILPQRNLATCYEITGDYETSMKYCQDVLKHWPNDKTTHIRIADLMTMMKNYDGAVKGYLDIIKKFNYPEEDAYYEIMNIYLEAGDLKRAEEYAIKSLTANTGSSVTARRVASFFFQIGKYGIAKRHMKRALHLTDDDDLIQYSYYSYIMAEIYFYEGKVSDAESWALKSLDALKKHYGSEEAYVSYMEYSASRRHRLGCTYYMLGDYQKAEQYLREAIDEYPCSTCRHKACFDGYYGLGKLYEVQNQFDLAEEYYKKAIELNGHYLFKRSLEELKNKRSNTKDSIFKKIWRNI